MITRVIVKNYRSLARVVVDMGPLVILVGPNGAGKSNFIDALRFVTDALSTTVNMALKQRGGIDVVRWRSNGRPGNFGIQLVLQLDDARCASYAFEIRAMAEGAFIVKKEQCQIWESGLIKHQYEIEEGAFRIEVPGMRTRIKKDRLGLTVLSAAEEFRPVYDALVDMRFYSLVPGCLRELQEPDPGHALKSDGSNAAAVLRNLQRNRPQDYERICRLLSKVVPGTYKVEPVSVGSKETLQFLQDAGDHKRQVFKARNASVGALSVVGWLLALYQYPFPSLVAIDDLGATIDSVGIGVLVDVLKTTHPRGQLLLATHVPAILDDKEIDDSQIRAVELKAGRTIIGPLDHAPREAIRRRLYSAGELMRMGELYPDQEVSEALAREFNLFGEEIPV